MVRNKPGPEPEHPWERRSIESEEAWAAFVRYRDLPSGVRTLQQVATTLKKTLQIIGRWSSRYQWVERCRAWDAFVDKKKREAEIDAVMDMRKRHIETSMALQGAGALALQKIIASERAPQIGSDGQPLRGPDGKILLAPLVLKPSEARDLIELGMRIERINRGEPEAIVEERVVEDKRPIEQLVYDYSKLSVEELKALKKLTEKARAIRSGASKDEPDGRSGKRDKP
jgi:hypothetical protein